MTQTNTCSSAISIEHEFPSGGEMGALIRSLDWSKSGLGPISAWPTPLKAAVRLMLPAKAQIVIFWGPELVALYNDAYAPTIGDKHPRALGRERVGPSYGTILSRCCGACLKPARRCLLISTVLHRTARLPRERVLRHFLLSCLGRGGQGGGVLCIVSETTERVVAQERQRLLLRETNHRLKNLFAMVDALIGLSVRSARTPQEFAQSLRGRLAALLRAKELVRPGTSGTEHAVSEITTVEALVRTILQPYDNDTSGRTY
jgi:hypothetical protein